MIMNGNLFGNLYVQMPHKDVMRLKSHRDFMTGWALYSNLTNILLIAFLKLQKGRKKYLHQYQCKKTSISCSLHQPAAAAAASPS